MEDELPAPGRQLNNPRSTSIGLIGVFIARSPESQILTPLIIRLSKDPLIGIRHEAIGQVEGLIS